MGQPLTGSSSDMCQTCSCAGFPFSCGKGPWTNSTRLPPGLRASCSSARAMVTVRSARILTAASRLASKVISELQGEASMFRGELVAARILTRPYDGSRATGSALSTPDGFTGTTANDITLSARTICTRSSATSHTAMNREYVRIRGWSLTKAADSPQPGQWQEVDGNDFCTRRPSRERFLCHRGHSFGMISKPPSLALYMLAGEDRQPSEVVRDVTCASASKVKSRDLVPQTTAIPIPPLFISGLKVALGRIKVDITIRSRIEMTPESHYSNRTGSCDPESCRSTLHPRT